METTTIQIDKALKEKLEAIKFHQRETFNEVIFRLLDDGSLENASKESLIETIKTLSNPSLMQNIAQGLQEYERGEGISFDDLKKELNIDV